MMSFRTSCAAAGAALLAMTSVAEAADQWPSRPIQMISPFTPGNANDIVARVVLDQVSRQIGQSFIVENRSGGGGSVGANSVAKADPDGYTVLLYSSSIASQMVMHKSLPFDPVGDFQPVVLFGIQPSVLVAAPSKGWKTVGELVATAKAKPGELNFASAGVGSASHLAGEKLRLAAHFQAQHIPFRGPVEAFTEVMSGRVDYYFLPIAPAIPNIKNGKVVALVVSTPRRATLLPEVPTVIEAGYPDAQYLFWGGIALPAKTPRAIADKLHDEVQKALDMPAVKERLTTLGVQPMPMSVDEYTKFVHDDVESTIKLAKAINLVPTN
jgi:tripartite-type tricarboxylate transporter receptor subunit TctC